MKDDFDLPTPLVWPKVCGCGRTFTKGEWKKLPLVGRHTDYVETIEMRNCSCGSTISQPVPAISHRTP